MNQFSHLQQFKSVQEFDQCRKSVFYTIKDKLSKGAQAVWNHLSQRATEVPGVCWVKIITIMESTGLSRSTVERAIRLLKKLGALIVQETTRPLTGGDGANVYVFQKLGEGAEMTGRDEPEKPCPSTDNQPESKNDTKIYNSKDININHLNTKRSPYIKFVPKSLQHFQAFFGKQVKDLYGRVWLAAKKLGVTVDQDIMQQIGFIAMNQLKQYQSTRKVQNEKELTQEELCKLAYGISYKQLTDRLDSGEILDWNYEAERLFSQLKRGKNHE